MIAFGKDKIKTIKLSKEEQLCILQNCEELTPALQNKIKHMTDGTISLMEGESDILFGCIAYTLESSTIDNEKVSETLDQVIKRIPFSNEMEEYFKRCDALDPNDPEAHQRMLNEIEEKKKTAPDPNRGNLTPQQITRFQDYYWGDAEFPLQFNHDLSLNEVNQSMFFRNTVLFLNKLIEFKDKPTATAKGNLNRKFVKVMFDEMELDEEYRDFTARYHKVLNEDDVFPLHISRIVCECAGLIKKRSNKITVLKKHYPLLSEEKAGELYYILFDAYFNKFNLSYLDRLPEMEGVQETLDFSLYRISVLCDKYQSVENMFYEAFLPAIINEIEEVATEYVRKEWYLTSRIIRPLDGFGLVECKYKSEEKPSHIDQVKKTSLFDKFISLNL